MESRLVSTVEPGPGPGMRYRASFLPGLRILDRSEVTYSAHLEPSLAARRGETICLVGRPVYGQFVPWKPIKEL
jgi:hypothetical protein